MLASVLTKAGAFGALIKPQGPQRILAVVQNRRSTSAAPDRLKQWDDADKLFYGPERDYKNFPNPVQPETSPAIRLGFIPDSWFQFFYNKTGVTGPYLFGTGLVLTALSKEIWVVDHGFSEVVGFWGAFIIITTKFGAKLGTILDETTDRVEDQMYKKPLARAKAQYEDTIKTCEENIWREDGQKYIFEAKKENIDLQLEAVYRKRLHQVYQEVKRRLDYQLDVQNTKRRFEQDHMVNWIVNGVVGSITPQQEKESLSKCIADLRGLSTA